MNISKNAFLLLALFWISISSCGQKQQEETSDENSSASKIELITPDELNNIQEEIVLIDVRTPEEYASGHLENAININFKDQNFKALIGDLDADQEVYIYCRSGGRSGNAAKMMEGMGFKKIYDLEGGIINWEKNNMKIVK